MNLPTKITTSRIVAIVILVFVLAILKIISEVDVNHIILDPVVLTLGNSHVNIIYLCVCIFFILAALTDMLDGRLARKLNQVTTLGKFLDPVADKLLVNTMVIFLCVPETYTANNQILFPVFCAIIMVARDIVVDMLRFIAAKDNVVIAANVFGKAKTVCQMITIPIVLLNGWPFAYFDINWNKYLRIVSFLIYITTFVSLISGIIYVVQNKRVFKHEN